MAQVYAARKVHYIHGGRYFWSITVFPKKVYHEYVSRWNLSHIVDNLVDGLFATIFIAWESP